MIQAELRTRDAERTREVILDAATRLFAAQGYAATGLQQVATEAGVARATPSYFFGSKEGLWKAVLEAQSRLLGQIVPNALAKRHTPSSREELLGLLVDLALDFYKEHPEFLRLMQWSELQGNFMFQEVATHRQAVQTAVDAAQLLLQGSALEQEDIRHVVLSLMSTFYSHLIFGHTLGGVLGLEVSAPEFDGQRRAHLKRLLLAAIR